MSQLITQFVFILSMSGWQEIPSREHALKHMQMRNVNWRISLFPLLLLTSQLLEEFLRHEFIDSSFLSIIYHLISTLNTVMWTSIKVNPLIPLLVKTLFVWPLQGAEVEHQKPAWLTIRAWRKAFDINTVLIATPWLCKGGVSIGINDYANQTHRIMYEAKSFSAERNIED